MRYAAFRDELASILKVAADAEDLGDVPKNPARVLGEGVLGMGLGMAGSYGALKGLDYALQKSRGQGVSANSALRFAPFVGGALGLGVPLFHYAMSERMKENSLIRRKIREAKLREKYGPDALGAQKVAAETAAPSAVRRSRKDKEPMVPAAQQAPWFRPPAQRELPAREDLDVRRAVSDAAYKLLEDKKWRPSDELRRTIGERYPERLNTFQQGYDGTYDQAVRDYITWHKDGPSGFKGWGSLSGKKDFPAPQSFDDVENARFPTRNFKGTPEELAALKYMDRYEGH